MGLRGGQNAINYSVNRKWRFPDFVEGAGGFTVKNRVFLLETPNNECYQHEVLEIFEVEAGSIVRGLESLAEQCNILFRNQRGQTACYNLAKSKVKSRLINVQGSEIY